MTSEQALVKTLDFQLDIRSDNESLLHDACLEARSVYDGIVLLAKQDVDSNAIRGTVTSDYCPDRTLFHDLPRTPAR